MNLTVAIISSISQTPGCTVSPEPLLAAQSHRSLCWSHSLARAFADCTVSPEPLLVAQSHQCLCWLHSLVGAFADHTVAPEHLLLEPLLVTQSCQSLCWLHTWSMELEIGSDKAPHLWPYWVATHTHLSHLMTKPTKWLCAQRRLRSAWASAQSDQCLHHPHEENLGP